MAPEHVEELIRTALPAAEKILVESTDNVHFESVVVAECFADMSRLQRQQRVYANLKSYIASGELHALALKTYTPAEWQAQQVV